MSVSLCLYVQVVIVNDPRPDNPYDHLYTVEYLNNMSDAPLVLYINQPSDVLKQLAFDSIKNNEVSLLLFQFQLIPSIQCEIQCNHKIVILIKSMNGKGLKGTKVH